MHIEAELGYHGGMSQHEYAVGLHWIDDTGAGTVDYAAYHREYRVRIAGKPDLVGSADALFRGDPTRHNPEDLLVAALASCHLLSYLALCARAGVRVLSYDDDARGWLSIAPVGGQFERVVLQPRVTIACDADLLRAGALHDDAHAACFISRSCNFPVTCIPTIERAAATWAHPSRQARQDLAVRLPHRPGALAELGEALGRAGVSLQGGGGFVVDSQAVVHFLVAGAPRAAELLRANGFDVLGVRDVIEQRLDQETPGQLGTLARAMADAGVGIECVYSDHDHALILCVDDLTAGRRVSEAWETRRRAAPRSQR